MDGLFKGIFDNELIQTISLQKFLLCMAVSLVVGIYLAAVYTYKCQYTQSFIISLALVPAVVCVVIMMVNGNVGAGVAVAGAFSLVRFRSAPGTAKEISAIFLAMGAGLMIGMGYLGYGVLFAVILGAVMLLYTALGMGKNKTISKNKTLIIHIPENLDYNDVFTEIMEKYTAYNELMTVKTTNMGSIFRLTYQITLKNPAQEKEFIDKLRTRNGNLEIAISKRDSVQPEIL